MWYCANTPIQTLQCGCLGRQPCLLSCLASCQRVRDRFAAGWAEELPPPPTAGRGVTCWGWHSTAARRLPRDVAAGGCCASAIEPAPVPQAVGRGLCSACNPDMASNSAYPATATGF